MQRSGTAKFTNSDDYRAGMRGAKVDLVFNGQKNFEARLTWVELRHLRLLRGQENLPRIARVTFAPDLVFIAFPTRHDPPQVCDGVELRKGDIVWHARGERVHQQTRGPSQWGFISLLPEHLAACGRALTGFDLVAPPSARILRPSRPDAARLLSLHAKACRLAETKPEMIAHPEVDRSLEQDLLHTLVNCLASDDGHEFSGPERHHKKIMDRFEEILAKHSERQLQISELCAEIGVSERTLRMCCAEFLGMSPNRYLRLQRLNRVHAALRSVESPFVTVAELARRFGFPELGRFAGMYRLMFGEMPSTTLRRARSPAHTSLPKLHRPPSSRSDTIPISVRQRKRGSEAEPR
jgi:AraC-like DNA-binding protein